jgi:hypothetical protein
MSVGWEDKDDSTVIGELKSSGSSRFGRGLAPSSEKKEENKGRGNTYDDIIKQRQERNPNSVQSTHPISIRELKSPSFTSTHQVVLEKDNSK